MTVQSNQDQTSEREAMSACVLRCRDFFQNNVIRYTVAAMTAQHRVQIDDNLQDTELVD